MAKQSSFIGCVTLIVLAAAPLQAQDWPQWRGAHRDAKAEFKAPKTWPKELTRKWSVPVGEGVSTPALAGDKLYVFSRQDGSEVLRCLSASDGKEIWQDKYESLGAEGPAQSFSGPRSSPAVADGKVVTLGVRGMLSCIDAASGKTLWRKDEFHAGPQFQVASSPMIVGNLCIAQLGGRENGALVAYDLATGEEKWRWGGPSPTYASPVLLEAGGTKYLIAQTQSKLVAINSADGKVGWESVAAGPGSGGPGGRPAGGPGSGGPGGGAPPPGGAEGGRRPGGGGMGRGGGPEYKAATPIVDGQTIITAGRGIRAISLKAAGGKLTEQELWNNPDKSVQFNTPVLKDGLIYGLAPNNDLYCVNAKDGKTAWSVPFPSPAASSGAPAERPPGPPGGGPGGPGGGRRGGGMGRTGFGSVVDAGSVLLALTPAGQLIAFEPNATEFKEVASYKVSDKQTHAYPVASGKRIFIKDSDAVTLWTVD